MRCVRRRGGAGAAHEAADKDQFVRLQAINKTLQAACAQPLLRHKGKGHAALDFRGIGVTKDFKQRRVTKAIANGWCSELASAERVKLAFDSQRD